MTSLLKAISFMFLLVIVTTASEPTKKIKVELLAKHKTIAEFQGIKVRACMGRTALCPDHCGHSGEVANFKIIEYQKYEKLGKYGSAKAKNFSFRVTGKTPKLILVNLKILKKGDRVILNWNHEYITQNGFSGPQRPIIKLAKITVKQHNK